MYFVYILECKDKSLYTGITTDVARRLKEHKGKKGGHYTSARQAVRMIFTEEHPDRSSASKREAEIKRWDRRKKLRLISTPKAKEFVSSRDFKYNTSMPTTIPKISSEIKKFNSSLALSNKKICKLLAEEITASLPKAENKIWHGAPVWFLDGNPIVGYDKLKDCVRLLFWSGQSFDEKGLKGEGSFKASEARYTDVSEIKVKDLKRWLRKSKDIQWDYKNIRKTRGVLALIKK